MNPEQNTFISENDALESSSQESRINNYFVARFLGWLLSVILIVLAIIALLIALGEEPDPSAFQAVANLFFLIAAISFTCLLVYAVYGNFKSFWIKPNWQHGLEATLLTSLVGFVSAFAIGFLGVALVSGTYEKAIELSIELLIGAGITAGIFALISVIVLISEIIYKKISEQKQDTVISTGVNTVSITTYYNQLYLADNIRSIDPEEHNFDDIKYKDENVVNRYVVKIEIYSPSLKDFEETIGTLNENCNKSHRVEYEFINKGIEFEEDLIKYLDKNHLSRRYEKDSVIFFTCISILTASVTSLVAGFVAAATTPGIFFATNTGMITAGFTLVLCAIVSLLHYFIAGPNWQHSKASNLAEIQELSGKISHNSHNNAQYLGTNKKEIPGLSQPLLDRQGVASEQNQEPGKEPGQGPSR